MLTPDNVRDTFDYDQAGMLIWRNKIADKVRVGAVAGAIRCGRWGVGAFGQRHILARVIWLWHHLKWPEGDVDHKDRDPLNNRIENLRDTSHQTNLLNRGCRNPPGRAGVREHRGKFVAQITVNMKPRYIGIFGTPEEAHQAFVREHLKVHGKESRFHPEHVFNLTK